MIRPRLSKVASGTRLTTDLVNDIINRTEYAADLLRQYKLVAGNGMYVEPHYDGTRVSYLQPVAGGATPKQPISPAYRIVGSYSKSGAFVGFVYDGTTYTDIVFPGATLTQCIDIYNGNIVGIRTLSGQFRGFLYADGNFTSLESPVVGRTSSATGIYENLITGTYITSGGFGGGYLYDGSSYQIILPPGANQTFDPKIDQNTIVGRFQTSGSTSNRGFITTTDLSSYITFTVPGASTGAGQGTLLTGIHNDTIIGFYFTASGKTTSFFLSGGNRTDVNYPGSSETRFVGIYENFVVGQYDSGYFLYDGSTFTPIIAPSGVANYQVFAIG
jgi:hypothetical protein